MNISHKFLTSDGLIPSTIFDKGNADMDISEEMEEIRELLYELIQKSFPRGVAADHLSKVYNEAYLDKSLGPRLPSNWLEQVKAAEEFEIQSRGPLTILFVRLHNSASLKKTNISPSTSDVPSSPIVSVGRNVPPSETAHNSALSPLQLAQMLRPSVTDSLLFSTPVEVTVVAYSNAGDFHIRLTEKQESFLKLKKEMRNEYGEKVLNRVQPHEVCVNGAYALKDSDGDFFRVIILSPPSHSSTVECYFVDVGVTGVFPVSSLRFLLLSTAQNVPSLSIRVFLEGMETNLNRSDDNTLKRILFDEKDGQLVPVSLMVTWMSCVSCSFLRGVRLSTCDGRDVIEILQDARSSGKENTRIPLGCPSSISCEDTPVPCGSLSNFDDILEMSPLDADRMPRRPFLAHPIYACGPGEISLRQASLDPMPDYLYDRLKEESTEPEATLTGSPVNGELYAALIEGIWQRVECVRASKIDPTSLLVYLIDVGAFHYTKVSTLRRLNALSPFKKMLAFKCKLFGVAPQGGADVWSRDAQLIVNDFFLSCQEHAVEVIPRGEWTNWHQMNAPSLPLVEASIRTHEGRDLADWLIYNRLAQPSI